MNATELPVKKLTTAQDYDLLQEGAPYQLIAGELVLSPSPNFLHQDVLGELFAELRTYVRKHNLGKVIISPMDVHLTVIDIYQPDLLFIRKENLSKIDPGDRIRIVPDLVVEVLSPSTAVQDTTRKKRIYAECGVAEYWIVNPEEQTVEVLRNNNGEYRRESLLQDTLRSPMFPEFSLPLETLFAQ